MAGCGLGEQNLQEMPEREEIQDAWHFQNSGFSRNITLHLLWSVHAARTTLVQLGDALFSPGTSPQVHGGRANGNRSPRFGADVLGGFLPSRPGIPTSPEWLALDRQLDPDHPVRQIARLTDEELNLDSLQRTYAGRGSRPHRPDLLLKLLIYEHSQGRPQPVQWLKDLKENIAVQWLVYGLQTVANDTLRIP